VCSSIENTFRTQITVCLAATALFGLSLTKTSFGARVYEISRLASKKMSLFTDYFRSPLLNTQMALLIPETNGFPHAVDERGNNVPLVI
jgi:hypothetical protein